MGDEGMRTRDKTIKGGNDVSHKWGWGRVKYESKTNERV